MNVVQQSKHLKQRVDDHYGRQFVENAIGHRIGGSANRRTSGRRSADGARNPNGHFEGKGKQDIVVFGRGNPTKVQRTDEFNKFFESRHKFV